MALEVESLRLGFGCGAIRFKSGPGTISKMITNNKGTLVIVMLDHVYFCQEWIWHLLVVLDAPTNLLFLDDVCLVVGNARKIQTWDLLTRTMIYEIPFEDLIPYYSLLQDKNMLIVSFSSFHMEGYDMTGFPVFWQGNRQSIFHKIFKDEDQMVLVQDEFLFFQGNIAHLGAKFGDAIYSYKRHDIIVSFPDQGRVTCYHVTTEGLDVVWSKSDLRGSEMVWDLQEEYFACRSQDQLLIIMATGEVVKTLDCSIRSRFFFSPDGTQILYHTLGMICTIDIFKEAKQQIFSLAHNHFFSKSLYRHLKRLTFVF